MTVETDKLRDTPNPGSDAAVAIGCTCPVTDNGHGRGAWGINGLFWRSLDCPVHAQREASES
jgi:hypothetical protein